MKFEFSEGPANFERWLMDTYLNELHVWAVLGDLHKIDNARTKFKPFVVEFFKAKGFETWLENNKIWFDIDENDSRWASH